MEQKDIDRLNELRVKFEEDAEYQEYVDLNSQAWKESNNARPKSSLMGSVNGALYYLLLPYTKLEIRDGKWSYTQHGLDMETRYPNGTYAVTCMSLCKKPAEYFINRMLEDAKKAEMDGGE